MAKISLHIIDIKIYYRADLSKEGRALLPAAGDHPARNRGCYEHANRQVLPTAAIWPRGRPPTHQLSPARGRQTHPAQRRRLPVDNKAWGAGRGSRGQRGEGSKPSFLLFRGLF